jgi:hypothetical protein
VKFNSWLLDKKISGVNVSVEFTIEEYWDFAKDILTSNHLQRKRVSVKGKTYELLARDLAEGCVMPPIILATGNEADNVTIDKIIKACIDKGHVCVDSETSLKEIIEKEIEKRNLIILDGLQRTFTISDCINEQAQNPQFLKQKLRAEIYIGLSKPGILYRMITLNTGQTPMSLRQQIEMLYQDYSKNSKLAESGITLLKEAQESVVTKFSEYKLSDAADMYYAYTIGSPNSYTKQSISTILKESEFLEKFDLDNSDELSDLVILYNQLILKLSVLYEGWTLFKKELEEDPDFEYDLASKTPFSRDLINIGSKVQVMAGFSSAISKLIANGQVQKLLDIGGEIDKITVGNKVDESLDWLIKALDEIKKTSNRVGDSQRAYFNLLFRHLFNPDHDSYLEFSTSIVSAKEAYDNSY